MFDFNFITIYAKGSPANFSNDYTLVKYIKDTRFIKSFEEPERKITDIKYKTILNEKVSDFVLLQTVKVIKYEIEVFFTESVDFNILLECEKITADDRNGQTFDFTFLEKSIERVEGTTLLKGIFTFKEIIKDEKAVSSHVESSYVLESKETTGYYFLKLTNDENIDTEEDLITGLTFYTIFKPIYYNETIGEDGILERTATGKKFTISNNECRVFRVKFFLNNENLYKFLRYYKSCWYYETGILKGVYLSYALNQGHDAEQPLIADDVTIDERDDLINMTEVTISVRDKFLRTNK